MKRFLIIFLIGLIAGPGKAEGIKAHLPGLMFFNLTPELTSVYYGEQVTLRMQMLYSYLKTRQEWRLPANMQARDASGVCPPFTDRKIYIKTGLCTFNLVIKGDQLGKLIDGYGLYYLYDEENGLTMPGDFHFAIDVRPHPLSLAKLPLQKATANLPLYFDLRNYVNYFDENVQAGSTPVVEVRPQHLDGLYYDVEHFAMVGRPSRKGSYQFNITVKNSFSAAESGLLNFDVGAKPQDKPVFKENYQVVNATPGQDYQLNLMDLIEPGASYLLNNSVHFRIDINNAHPDWLKVAGHDNAWLQGKVPLSEAGTTSELTLIASSNTGGDSEPLRLQMAIATDPASRPQISSFSLEETTGTNFEYDLHKHIVDPANDPSLQLILDRVEPAADWLKFSLTNPTLLTGSIPGNVAGQHYQLTLHAHTKIGGNSEPAKISLAIASDPEKKPRFKVIKPQLPLLYLGLPYEHDFVSNRDIYPDYEEEAYEIELAEGYNNPSWLRMENNKLIADKVPDFLMEQDYEIYLTIKNKPGGKSEVIPLILVAMI